MPKYSVAPELYDQSIPQITTAKLIVKDYLRENSSQDKKMIIDACCGTGKLSKFLAHMFPNGRILGVDNAENMITFANGNREDLDNISFQLEDLTVFNESLKNSADLIVCSWAVSHIPQEKQKVFTNNLYHYLKKNGQLISLFPVKGSVLSITIQETVKSDNWKDIFIAFESKRSTFTKEEYKELLINIGFVDPQVQLHTEEIVFKNNSELRCFIITSVARYISYLEDPILCYKFIDDVCNNYQQKMGGMDSDIPYSVSIMSANAKRLSLTSLLQKVQSPVYVDNSPKVVELSSNSVQPFS